MSQNDLPITQYVKNSSTVAILRVHTQQGCVPEGPWDLNSGGP